ncbi:MAG: ATP-binding protein, partial [Desulfovermiculus sp.]
AQHGLSESFAQLIPSLEQGEIPMCCRHAGGNGDVCLIQKPSSTCRDCPLVHSCVHSDTLCIALQYMDTVYGFLTVALPLGQGENAEEQSLLNDLASDIAFALHGLEREEKTKLAEEEKKAVEKQLAQAQKMEAIGRLAGGVAHDFNNMLGVILGYADIALSHLERSDHLYNPLGQIKQAAQRSADMTRQLLAFSRKQLTQPQVLDLNQEIESQRQMLSRLIGENIELKLRAADQLWPVEVDPSQVDQVLANLVINARDAICDVGSIMLETRNVTLDQAYTSTYPYAEPGDYVCLMVSDTGTGMDRETQEQIFDPFFTTKLAEQGTGLGLSTVYGIVKQNQGIIHVYSEKGKGTTVKLYFPRTQGPVSSPEEKAVLHLAQGNETVLLVEDEEMVLELTQYVLEEQGYTVLTARSPKEAQHQAKEYTGRIDVLLTDVILPEMNGKELKAVLESVRPEIKTLFMSGYTENVIVQQGMVDPQFFFIQKPFSAAGLMDTIRKVLSS